MFKISNSMAFSVLQSIAEYYRVLQSVTEYYRVLHSDTECYRVLQSVTECYRVLDLDQFLGLFWRELGGKAEEVIFKSIKKFASSVFVIWKRD